MLRQSHLLNSLQDLRFHQKKRRHKILLLDAVDDFLMLTSFAARQRCVCLGWDSDDSSKITRFFRRDMAIPEIKRDHSYNEVLIDLRDFKDFMTVAYNNFIEIKSTDLIR